MKQLTSPDIAGAPGEVDQPDEQQDIDRRIDHLGAAGLIEFEDGEPGRVDTVMGVHALEFVRRFRKSDS